MLAIAGICLLIPGVFIGVGLGLAQQCAPGGLAAEHYLFLFRKLLTRLPAAPTADEPVE